MTLPQPEEEPPERIDYVERRFVGKVIGSHGKNLTRTNLQTGACMFRYHDQFYLAGSKKARAAVHHLVKKTIVSPVILASLLCLRGF